MQVNEAGSLIHRPHVRRFSAAGTVRRAAPRVETLRDAIHRIAALQPAHVASPGPLIVEPAQG